MARPREVVPRRGGRVVTVVCARCAATEEEHPGGYCPDVVERDAGGRIIVENGETRIFEAAENGEWDGEAVVEEEGIHALVEGMAVVPVTGEVVNLANPAEVARALATVEEIAAKAGEAKRILNDALVRYADEVALARTFEIPGVGKFEKTGGPKTSYDNPAALKKELLDLGVPPARVAEIVVETVDRKVSGTEANKAAKANPAVEEVIARYRRKGNEPYKVNRKG